MCNVSPLHGTCLAQVTRSTLNVKGTDNQLPNTQTVTQEEPNLQELIRLDFQQQTKNGPHTHKLSVFSRVREIIFYLFAPRPASHRPLSSKTLNTWIHEHHTQCVLRTIGKFHPFVKMVFTFFFPSTFFLSFFYLFLFFFPREYHFTAQSEEARSRFRIDESRLSLDFSQLGCSLFNRSIKK